MHAWRTQWLAGARAPSVRPHGPQRAVAGTLRGRRGNVRRGSFRTESFAAAQASRRSRTAARARRFPTASTSPFSSGPARRRSPTPRRARARGGRLAACCMRSVASCLLYVALLHGGSLHAACCLPAPRACGAVLSSCRRGARAVGGGRCTFRPQRACSAHSVGSASAFSPTAPARGTYTRTRAPRRTRTGVYTHGRIRTWTHAHGRGRTHARSRAGRPLVCLWASPLVGCTGTRSSQSTSTRSRARAG
jgi:hypothetical protein